MRKSLIIVMMAMMAVMPMSGQKKFEFRAAWIATVANIDWPDKENRDPEKQREDMVQMLDSLQKLNFNAVVFQIRPTADAFYDSKTEPWSYYLTGVQGQAPEPYYDPLAFVIHEAHRRNIDVHVWINPYRILNGESVSILSKNSIFFKKPYMVLKYGGKYYFNPGLDETREYLNNIVADIVSRYDIDGVHFDDYFYPYRVAGEEFPDEATFQKYPREFDDKNDWRRNNVNMVISELSQTIHALKPWVEFGISPFGVWRNYNKDACGSKTTAGTTNYDDLYADVRLWLEKGWIDYVVPQLYWEIGKKNADYKVLVDWWSKNSFGRNLYIGLYASGLKINKAQAWKTPNELCRQLTLNKKFDNVSGAVFYSCKPMLSNPQGLCDSLATNYYKYKALVPPNPSLKGKAPAVPQNVEIRKLGKRDYLWWSPVEPDRENEPAITKYIVYMFDAQETADLNRTDKIVSIVRDVCLDLSGLETEGKKFVVTAVNRYHYESAASEEVTL